jgi:hypothetical protein
MQRRFQVARQSALGDRQQESEMRAFNHASRLCQLFLAVLLCTVAVSPRSFADDKTADKNATNPPAKPSPVKVDAPAPLTERERWLLDEVEELKKRVAELESKVSPSVAPAAEAPAAQPASAKAATPTVAPATPGTAPAITSANSESASSSSVVAPVGPQATEKGKSAAKVPPSEPFAYADWTWLNGTPRNKDVVWDSKFFTPEIRLDTSFVSSFNHPKDDSLGGSTEIFRSNEIQVEQISFGGDFHWQNVRGRILTLGGMFGVTTPRNDASVGRGQWDLRGAYKYFGEAYGGYHFNVNHGLNIDAGIFVSYIGLFSYYNYDNWTYQPSYVSSNTPWFFNGLRIQWFPTAKLKIEPWIINGWQSYGRFGNHPGLGGQILYRPKPWLSFVFNNYGYGEDTLTFTNPGLGRSRIHTDDSVEVKYYDNPSKTLDKMAFSLTGDLGCEYGGGVSCWHNTKTGTAAATTKQAFAGWMFYNRFWFKKDLFGLTIGGGELDNPGRYLTLLPPINGADAVSGSPYFTLNPGDKYKAWDNSVTLDWMPKQYITFRSEFGYRHADQPYFTGRGGITPPGGNTGSPGSYVCTNGVNTSVASSFAPSGNGFAVDNANGAVQASCAANGMSVWQPDLRKNEPSVRLAIMVKF